MNFYQNSSIANYYCDSAITIPRYYVMNCLHQAGLQVNQARLLEVGCGDGNLAQALHGMPLNITCIDYSPQMITRFNERIKSWKLRDQKIACAVLQASAMNTQQRQNSHDALILMNAIHWLLVPEEAANSHIQQMRSILVPNAPVIAMSTFPSVKPLDKITDSATDPTAYWSFVQADLRENINFNRGCQTLKAHRTNTSRRGMMQRITGNEYAFSMPVEKYEVRLTLDAAISRIHSLQPYEHISSDEIETVCRRHFQNCSHETRWMTTAFIGAMCDNYIKTKSGSEIALVKYNQAAR